MSENTYSLKISRRTVDKLGVKLYDRVALVIAELVSNAYDADAPSVVVKAPLGEFLATRKSGQVEDRGYTIEVIDHGIGMTPSELQDYYLVVGADRRADNRRGATSPGGRPVTGRKGVGKLAPFGICRTIEVISAGGQKKTVKQGNKSTVGYETAHIVLRYDAITSDDETDYHPDVGSRDGTLSPDSGTTIILRDFLARKVPDADSLAEELAQRFGIDTGSQQWNVRLEENRAGHTFTRTLSPLDIALLPDTKVAFSGPRPTLSRQDASGYSISLPNVEGGASFSSSFVESGITYPVVGWMAFAKEPVKREHHAGIRIYCRGKFAAQTLGFDIASGFTGELNVRSYLIGELHCDWLDEEEDLIHTDRQNILWSTDIGTAFQAWGRSAVRELARSGRRPAQKRTVEIFSETLDLKTKLDELFPGKNQASIKKRAEELAVHLAQRLRPEEAADAHAAQGILDLASAFAPHSLLAEELRRASESSEAPTIGAVAGILKRARFAESMTLGAVVKQRLQIIDRFERLINDTTTEESALQSLLEEAPWLIRPDWTPITENKSLKTVRTALETFLTKKLKKEVLLSAIANPTKRPDFVMISGHGTLELVEIKKPMHGFASPDLTRLWPYTEAFDEFFSNDANKEMLNDIKRYRITLVCDSVNLKGLEVGSFKSLKTEGKLEQKSWAVLVKDTTRTHNDFIEEIDGLGTENA